MQHTQIQLSQKERKVLQDQKKHEEVCIRKYDHFAQKASDPQLRNMFAHFADQERQHYNSLDQLLQGRQPTPSGGGRNRQQTNPPAYSPSHNRDELGQQHCEDAIMCRDAMMMEQFISDSYNQGLFQSMNPVVRQTLQHIQDEEQQHGEGILNYLQEQGMQG